MANIALNKPSGGQLILSPEDGTSTELLNITPTGFPKQSGEVVKQEWHPTTWSSFDSSNNIGYLTVQQINFTPTYTDSTIIVTWSSHLYKYNTTTFPAQKGRITIDGSEVWQNNYITYHEADQYMYTFNATGSASSSGTLMDIRFQADPAGSRLYFYGNTGGMMITEVAA